MATKMGRNTKREFPAPNIYLSITQHLIDTAVRNSRGNCMIARALREWAERRRESIWSITVSAEMIAFNLNDDTPTHATRYCYPTPATAAAKLKQWDEDLKFQLKPFEVRLHSKQGFMRPVGRRMPNKSKDTIEVTVKSSGKNKSERVVKVEKKPHHNTGKKYDMSEAAGRRCDRRWAGLAVIDGKKPAHKEWRERNNA